MNRDPTPDRIDTHPAVWLSPAALLLIALLPLPYGFYTFLRLIVCGTAIYMAYQEYQLQNQVTAWLIVFVISAVLFNPLIPVHLTREIWMPIDIAAAVMFLAHWRQRGLRGGDAC